MKTLLTLAAVFGVSFGGIWYLDQQGKLPESYTGAPSAKADEAPPPRWYTVGEPFALTVRGEGSVRMTVALQLPKRLPAFVEKGDRKGRLAQEPVIRAIVTETVMDRSARSLRSNAGRRKLERLLRRRIRAHTDVRVRRVVIPDVTVQ
ncbi:MAG: flagellar basal body-associated FliL family protein [Solirubrobacteraceae bacterium]